MAQMVSGRKFSLSAVTVCGRHSQHFGIDLQGFRHTLTCKASGTHQHARLQRHSASQGPGGLHTHCCRYFHGGGWVLGGNISHRAVAATLASECKATVVAVDYALAPEHPYPAGVEDSWAAVQWAAQNAGTLELLGYDLHLFISYPC